MYIVNFNTGAGNQEAATLEEAKQVAVDLMTYTQRDITIETEDGEVIATARWHVMSRARMRLRTVESSK